MVLIWQFQRNIRPRWTLRLCDVKTARARRFFAREGFDRLGT
jgi:hypothetical protein